jgi:hypothetical protein
MGTFYGNPVEFIYPWCALYSPHSHHSRQILPPSLNGCGGRRVHGSVIERVVDSHQHHQFLVKIEGVYMNMILKVPSHQIRSA